MSLSEKEQKARAEILKTVVKRLKDAATLENFAATEIVVRNYYSRMNLHLDDGQKVHGIRKLQHELLLWEKEVVLHMAEMDQISQIAAEHYIEEVDELINKSVKANLLHMIAWTGRHFFHFFAWREPKQRTKDLVDLKELNQQIIRGRLNALNISEDDPAYVLIAAEHEQVVSTRMGIAKDEVSRSISDSLAVLEVAVHGFHLERMLIQQMMEAKRLSWKTAKIMQANITLLEAYLQVE
jgi:hypothetical protein